MIDRSTGSPQDWLCEVTHPGEPCPAESAAEIRKSAGETTGALRGTGGGCPADTAPTSSAACPLPDGSLCGTCPDCQADAINDAQWPDGGDPVVIPERAAAQDHIGDLIRGWRGHADLSRRRFMEVERDEALELLDEIDWLRAKLAEYDKYVAELTKHA